MLQTSTSNKQIQNIKMQQAKAKTQEYHHCPWTQVYQEHVIVAWGRERVCCLGSAECVTRQFFEAEATRKSICHASLSIIIAKYTDIYRYMPVGKGKRKHPKQRKEAGKQSLVWLKDGGKARGTPRGGRERVKPGKIGDGKGISTKLMWPLSRASMREREKEKRKKKKRRRG
ncbi:uncharacterized protein MCYG_02013 [Microsporum canis CBS 113480]|uniref:Uncharacterized protein n=1 Tax=Arthroderma otae (strain ATCC MYA-4605 / CBS 113480) TaxID=554155 RepID=C5FIV3_ARTOC|nr:uncharacterized protein MCYG_02013 [Microsporum canis CBS 113480]EEQ29194.1 predicted protein [Microsporum canis CBS 113480]